MSGVWRIFNCLRNIILTIIKELRKSFQLVKRYQETAQQRDKKTILNLLFLEVIKYIIAICCGYLGVSEGMVPIIKLLVEILLGG